MMGVREKPVHVDPEHTRLGGDGNSQSGFNQTPMLAGCMVRDNACPPVQDGWRGSTQTVAN